MAGRGWGEARSPEIDPHIVAVTREELHCQLAAGRGMAAGAGSGCRHIEPLSSGRVPHVVAGACQGLWQCTGILGQPIRRLSARARMQVQMRAGRAGPGISQLWSQSGQGCRCVHGVRGPWHQPVAQVSRGRVVTHMKQALDQLTVL